MKTKNLMKWKTLLLMLFISTAMIMSSCNDDDDDGIVEGDKTELNALIAQAEALVSSATTADYPQAAIDAFNSTLATVKTTAATPLTQIQIDNLETQLTEAMNTFDSQAYGFIDNDLYLVAGWNFDEGTGTTATSFSTAKQVATFSKGWTALLGTDAQMPTWIDGVKGKAIHLDKGAHLQVPYSPGFLPASITISAWIKNEVQGWENNCIVSQNYWWGYKFQTQLADKPLFTERIDANSAKDLDADAGIVTPNVWTHVVVSLNSATKTMSFYIDGVNVRTYTEEDGVGPLTQTLSFVDGANTYTPQPFLIGSFATDAEIADKPGNFDWINTANVASFKGAIDELKIYNIALTDGQVSKLHNDEKP